MSPTEANPLTEHDLLLQAVTAADVYQVVEVREATTLPNASGPDYPQMMKRMSERHRTTYQRQFSENYRLKKTNERLTDRLERLNRENMELRRKILELEKTKFETSRLKEEVKRLTDEKNNIKEAYELCRAERELLQDENSFLRSQLDESGKNPEKSS
jgi:predicted nuclease with TOPRIM domain